MAGLSSIVLRESEDSKPHLLEGHRGTGVARRAGESDARIQEDETLPRSPARRDPSVAGLLGSKSDDAAQILLDQADAALELQGRPAWRAVVPCVRIARIEAGLLGVL